MSFLERQEVADGVSLPEGSWWDWDVVSWGAGLSGGLSGSRLYLGQ